MVRWMLCLAAQSGGGGAFMLRTACLKYGFRESHEHAPLGIPGVNRQVFAIDRSAWPGQPWWSWASMAMSQPMQLNSSKRRHTPSLTGCSVMSAFAGVQSIPFAGSGGPARACYNMTMCDPLLARPGCPTARDALSSCRLGSNAAALACNQRGIRDCCASVPNDLWCTIVMKANDCRQGRMGVERGQTGHCRQDAPSECMALGRTMTSTLHLCRYDASPLSRELAIAREDAGALPQAISSSEHQSESCAGATVSFWCV